MKTPRVALVLAPVALVVAVIVLVAVALIGMPWWLALALGIAVGGANAAAFYFRSEDAAVGRVRLRVVTSEDEPRLHNMVDGLCDSHGFRRPALALIDDGNLNALVFGRSPARATLAITTGLRDSLSRLELEGLLARELTLATHDGLPAATVLVPLLSVMPKGARRRVVAWFLGHHRAVLDDFGAVRLTRYPPGLAAALDKLARASTVIAGAGPTSGHLWVATPTAAGLNDLDSATIDERVAALREL